MLPDVTSVEQLALQNMQIFLLEKLTTMVLGVFYLSPGPSVQVFRVFGDTELALYT
jgi:hypothetical protein